MTRLPASWQTKQLTIQEGTPVDVPHLMTLFNACSHLEPWDPTFRIYPEETFIALVENSVAGEMGNGRFQLQAIHQNEQMMGYFHCSHHNPHPHTLFISMFVLHPDYQNPLTTRLPALIRP